MMIGRAVVRAAGNVVAAVLTLVLALAAAFAGGP
jgi:hypothetical protein